MGNIQEDVGRLFIVLCSDKTAEIKLLLEPAVGAYIVVIKTYTITMNDC